ncbi:MAG: succinylglutamate desuccinylase/aspartoacylase family protein [Planctomycetota bacterium]
MSPSKRFQLAGVSVPRGTVRDIRLPISERYTGDPISLPLRVIRGRESGPTLFVSAAVHGEELNGTGVIHELMHARPPTIKAGTLILVPVVNIFGFEVQSRYMPDRRDLNRSFPGSATGSLTRRVANIFFEQIVKRSDFGIDLHTAAAQRTNFPNVRGDLNNEGVKRLAKAFGCELMVHGKGPEGSLRREATAAGCPTMILEAGEPLKIEPGVLEIGLRGVNNVMVDLGMIKGQAEHPSYQARINKSLWVRASVGGFLRFHVSPGELVAEGQPIATNTSVFGQERNVLESPTDGIVLGMTTLPTVKPGEPVCHIALPQGSLRQIRRAHRHVSRDKLHRRLRRELATNITLAEREAESATDVVDDRDG